VHEIGVARGLSVRAEPRVRCTVGTKRRQRVPVTAKLSKRFYDRLGEEIDNELVDWFNQVDATYRSDLREISDLNFARFDAKVEQRFAQFDAKWERRFADLAASQTRLMVALWASLLIPILGLWVR
jgi:hypothetical protein